MTGFAPSHIHNATGGTYQPNPEYVHQDVPAATRGVSETDYGFPEWLRALDRKRLARTVRDSIARQGDRP